ncbi:MAG: class I SAM-dependent methyltransferase, partial [Acidimicrobiales bacterium]
MRSGPPGTIRDAYSATGTAWQEGPARIYDRLAEILVERSPVSLAGRKVLDLGSGTGAASRAALAAAAIPIALDGALGMLLADRHTRPPAVVGDLRALPLRDRCLDGVIAAFSLNHIDDPARGLREAARVVGPGGPLLASAYATDDTHAVKQAVE